MTGDELKTIRRRLGLSAVQMGRAFGYEGSDVTVNGQIRKYESGSKADPAVAGSPSDHVRQARHTGRLGAGSAAGEARSEAEGRMMQRALAWEPFFYSAAWSIASVR
jgi:hypothetical protein